MVVKTTGAGQPDRQPGQGSTPGQPGLSFGLIGLILGRTQIWTNIGLILGHLTFGLIFGLILD